jgi:hypothetical protein
MFMAGEKEENKENQYIIVIATTLLFIIGIAFNRIIYVMNISR